MKMFCNQVVVMVAQVHECTKSHSIAQFKRVNVILMVSQESCYLKIKHKNKLSKAKKWKHLIFEDIRELLGQAWWLTAVIPAFLEAEA